ncbi:MAG: NDP-sugar synthase [Clostridia bacterium]|nr:NDP-sugar synthase [Clostridia bacterium]
MKAVIMAGGEGTRLRPLTCDCPKPMTRLCGRPVIEYILDLLKANGVTEAAVTLRYLPEAIRGQFPDGDYQGMKLSFFEEDEPLGTAGSVKNAAGILDDDFIVISGDSLCDFGLAAAVEYHKKKKAAATLLLSHVADPREYGLVVTEPSGRVRGFVEKPGWAQAITDAVNTGIYIISPDCLKLIPDGKMFDFAKDLFPLLMERGMPVYGCETDGYWCDIGDIGAYTSCQLDMLEGRVECRLPGARQGGVQLKDGRPGGGYRILPPVYIGSNVRIGNDAVIGPSAVIDDGCTIGAGATVKNSILLPEAYIGERCELRGALV